MVLVALFFSCAPSKKTITPAKPEKIELTTDNQDSTEYELTIIDPGFESWFEMHRKPVWYYTKDYLAAWNIQYVTAWNMKVRDVNLRHVQPDNPFIMEIDYQPRIDYSLELNYKLYHYFLFIESTWGKILTYDRRN
jgi:hypothetical protein